MIFGRISGIDDRDVLSKVFIRNVACKRVPLSLLYIVLAAGNRTLTDFNIIDFIQQPPYRRK